MQKSEKANIHRLRFALKNKPTWLHIRAGRKTVETRAGTIKYQRVKEGDILLLCCGKSRLKKKVRKVRYVSSISALLKLYKPGVINPGVTTKREMEAMYYSYPGYKEKIKAFGIIAFELQ